MDFITFISIFVLTYLNSKLAQRKGQKHMLWALVTVACMFLGAMLCQLVLIIPYYELLTSDMAALLRLLADPRRMLIVFFGAMGGYLVIRYILEKIPDPPGTEKDQW